MKRNLFHQPEIVTHGEFGIVANVEEPDRQMRTGAKCWLAGGTGGEGWDRFQWLGLTRGHDTIVKWIPTHRMANFRAAWVPDHLRGAVYYARGTREEMEKMAADLNDFAEAQRKDHPNRRSMKSRCEMNTSTLTRGKIDASKLVTTKLDETNVRLPTREVPTKLADRGGG